MRPLLRLLAGLIAAILLAFPALAADRAIIVLDASGSMWAQIDGKSRIEIARDSLKQVAPALIRIDGPVPVWSRSTFHGLAQVIIQSTGEPGAIVLETTSPGLAPATLKIPVH